MQENVNRVLTNSSHVLSLCYQIDNNNNKNEINMNYLVFSIDAKKDLNDASQVFKGYKEFKTKQAALNCAGKRNELISTQAMTIEYLVHDKIENKVLRAHQ